ncbi:MAG TPA: hypothetical protein VHO50_11645 [Bacteroidales bacterium]|nr:hypothetical protein [Bacteroidales bacterium]
MERKDFINRACTLCGCALMGGGIANAAAVRAIDDEKQEDWRIPFMQTRFAEVIGKMKLYLAEENRLKVIDEIGRYCASENPVFDQLKGNVEGFLTKVKESWVETTEYDKKRNIIRIIGKPTKTCGCPMVADNKIIVEFCNCSKGYMETAMSKMTGKSAHATISSSVLRGDAKCSFTIELS